MNQSVFEAQAHVLGLTADLRREQDSLTAEPPAGTEQNAYDLIIPIFNGLEALRRCLHSVLAHTRTSHTIWLVNDASTDPAVATFASELTQRHEHVQALHLPTNLGFPGAVNSILKRTSRDVVLLNSDTVVPAGWLARLDRCRRSDPRIGTVSPLSNNATLCSTPYHNAPGPLVGGHTVQSMDLLVSQSSLRRFPRVPTTVGFCMLITRHTFNTVGLLDCAFGRGYGEEVDFCQRAWAAGLESALCDDLFVYHEGESSFAQVPEKAQLQRDNAKLLDERWPSYRHNVATYSTLNPLGLQQKRVINALRSAPAKSTPAVVHVVHDYESRTGTAAFVRKLIHSLTAHAQQTVVYPVATGSPRDAAVQLSGELLEVRYNPLSQPVEHTVRGGTLNLRSASSERFFAETLLATKAQFVHFSHLANLNSFALPAIARSLGATVTMVLHDYYLLCPDWTLLDLDDTACGKPQVDESTQCQQCLRGKQQSVPQAQPLNLTTWTQSRQQLAQWAASQAHTLIAPSQFVKNQFARAWGNQFAERIQVIGHGTCRPSKPSTPRRGDSSHQPLRVAFLGNFLPEKGSRVFARAAELLANQGSNMKLVVHGSAPPGTDEQFLEFCGPYEPDQLATLLEKADVVVIASVWHEVYCYALDEALRHGVAVIAARSGALAERIRDGFNGLLVQAGNAEALVQALQRLDCNRSLLNGLRQAAVDTSLPTEEESLERYRTALLSSSRPKCVRSQVVRARMLASSSREALTVAPPQTTGLDRPLPIYPQSVQGQVDTANNARPARQRPAQRTGP